MRNDVISRLLKPRYRILIVHSVTFGKPDNHVFVQKRNWLTGDWEYKLDHFLSIDFKSVPNAFDEIHSWHKWRNYVIECVKFDSQRVF